MSPIRTASGKAPPANGIAAPRLNATAEAGAIVVTDWNNTPGRPIAFLRSVVCSEDEEVSESVAITLLLLYTCLRVEIVGSENDEDTRYLQDKTDSINAVGKAYKLVTPGSYNGTTR
jgi:hypothetical protein